MVKAAVDKWKTKKWFEIIAPPLFNEKKIGETLAADYRMLIGRKIEVSLSDLGGDQKFQRVKLIFKIENVKGEKALTDYLGHKITHDYERGLVRRRNSKIYEQQPVETKDGRKIAVKSLVVVSGKVNPSVKSSLRAALRQVVESNSKEKKFDELIYSMLHGELSMKIKKELHKITPVRHAVIEKAEIVKE